MFSKNVLSVDIGTYNIKMVVGKYINNNVIIDNVFSLPTPPNVVQDGQITNIDKLKDIIYDALKNRKIKTKKVIFTLESTSIITRELLLPYVKEKDLEQMLEYEIQQQFPTTLEEYVIQYKKLEEVDEIDSKKIRILVATLPKIIAQNYLELVKKLNLKPIALDSHSNAISKLFHKNVKINDEQVSKNENAIEINIDKNALDENKTIAIVDLGYENININIIDDGILKFSRLLTVGGKEIDIHIANTFNISLKDAEKKKRENVMLYDNIIRSCVNDWIEEMQRIFKYYTSRKPGNKIDKIYLLGGQANLTDIDQYFKENFYIPIQKIERMSNINLEHLKLDFDIKVYLNAIGAIIRR
ncbi:type IV pilus assembly protein PilM [Crassaminicella thermophila]|uniref:Type IV pilus assembly protein PilM n=1 Tax=Crassaminicella thermophila TaxID=2599308 RepID=A0A5C0SD24_CRATE|nr:type IV pilus assembly protein PilM [Crassaminicella thermophila]QEK12131.1 type IV pilus assembly protein PilM [Crassaminicella thermophila]